jgi:ferredoxin
MSHRVDPNLLSELKEYGDINVEACFNCGNCTAICPLSTEDGSFPRRMIRYAQVGMRDQLLGSKELWMCYYCGDCSETCPRQAEPGEFMAATRRYAIASYDRLGLAKMLNTSPVLSSIFLVVLAVLIGLFMYTQHGPMTTDSLLLFEFIPDKLIHNLGLALMVFVGLVGLLGVANMVSRTARANGLTKENILGDNSLRFNWVGALWNALAVESLGQKRYREDCEAVEEGPPWYLQKWFIHASVMWGFLGLLAATSLDYALALLGVKETGTWVPIWYPVRLLGTVAGLLLVYGTSAAIVKRLLKTDRAFAFSSISDWAFLILMWLSGVSGFVLEFALYLPRAPLWGYWVFLIHVAVAVEMLLLIPFTKFAHAIYRIVALFMYSLKPMPKTKVASAEGLVTGL